MRDWHWFLRNRRFDTQEYDDEDESDNEDDGNDDNDNDSGNEDTNEAEIETLANVINSDDDSDFREEENTVDIGEIKNAVTTNVKRNQVSKTATSSKDYNIQEVTWVKLELF